MTIFFFSPFDTPGHEIDNAVKVMNQSSVYNVIMMKLLVLEKLNQHAKLNPV